MASADQIIDGVRKEGGDAELTYLVPAKTRPILILTDPPSAHHEEVTALRLLRLAKLRGDDQQAIRDQQDELLFYLQPDRFKLREENAAMVSALVRVHLGAIESGPALGGLNDNEMRVLGERIIRFYGFDTRLLVAQQIEELIARQSQS